MAFHWGQGDSKSSWVSRTLLSILADLSKAIAWMVSIPPLISRSSNPFSRLLWTVPSTPTTICITITFILHSFLSCLARFKDYSIFSFTFNFVVSGNGNIHNIANSNFYYLLSNSNSDLLAGIRWSVWISKSLVISSISWEFYAFNSLRRALACAYTIW